MRLYRFGLVGTLVVSLALASHASAQDAAPQLPFAPGRWVRMTVDGVPRDVLVVGPRDGGVHVSRGRPGDGETIALARITEIEWADSVTNGVAAGAITGAVPATLLGVQIRSYCRNEAGRCEGAPWLVGALGGLVGAFVGGGIDAAHRQVMRVTAGRVSISGGLGLGATGPAATLRVTF